MSADHNSQGEAMLRSNFEPFSTRWAVRRAQWIAMGIPEADLEKPKIAVVNSSSRLSICFAHLDALSEIVQQAIRDAGALPFEIRTTAPSDFVTSAGKSGRYLMPSRDLLANDIEAQVEGAVLDGMVLLASCDKTTPGQLMAAARLNIPSLVLACGYQLGGDWRDGSVDIEDVYKSVGSVKAGLLSPEDLTEMTRHAIHGPGVCAGLATANSMHCMAEALGMALPGNAPIRAGSERLDDFALAAGAAIVDLVGKDLRPRAILTEAAFRNAVTVAMALGASVNVVRHLTAVAVEAGLDLDVVGLFERLDGQVPQIARIRPNGPDRIETFDAAGGCRGALVQLADRLALDAMTVAGPLAQTLAAAPPPDANIIRPAARPFAEEPGLVILRGSLAPDGAVVKLSAVPREIRRFSGRARVFEDEGQAIEGLRSKAVQPGDVVVLRRLGPKGGPGTVFAASFMAALVGAGLGASVAVVTDGELSGLNSGITVGQVMPEAAEGGPLALIADGDPVTLDLDERRIDLLVDAAELAARAQSVSAPVSAERGLLAQYAELVQPLRRGAVLSAVRR